MNTTNYHAHSEYAFRLDELQQLVDDAINNGDDTFYITVGYECDGSSGNRSYIAKIEGSTGVRPAKSASNHILGCPVPPDCPDTLNTL